MNLRVTPRDSRATARAKLGYLVPVALGFLLFAGVAQALREWADGMRAVWRHTPTE